MSRHPLRSPGKGFTLIELMVVIALMAILIALSVPSFRNMIEMQRLRGVHGELATDLQFARAEAAARGRYVRVNFGSTSTLTCYSIYTAPSSATRCDCTLGAGSACPPGAQEIKTTQVQRDGAVSFELPTGQDTAFMFDYISGGLVSSTTDTADVPLAAWQVDTRIDDDRRLRTIIIQTGRPSSCAPNASVMQVTAC